MQILIDKLLAQPQASQWVEAAPWIMVVLIVWSLVWKGMALWRASRLSSKTWFVVLLLVNTLGILEIIYLYAISKKPGSEMEDRTKI
ncbi:hypothetical protein A2121_02710 [Candidatus Nomurabacteria bacterium GWB1_40_6]|uniref:DUF5652 domain-containing protein n=1 Tax=Candidatus Nomurabacteria bacterium GWB1_40_6 TaxID=1801727 RepID=A0A1F6TKI4_9BACT|nr:MAG: hypothetical protein UT49_C0007G0004 [Parcubacteria group bacterium GW2011_GWF1_39_37]KKR51754.1 MAG: hypothetical protein UT89_C0008G0004 [Parcubacteria group bacterium GW2011_GWE1_40_20]OGI45599.1 MAG: hypothetical protein A2121_02710 [Candidatus Nomurabacteria bacterium GWB1_40_6]HBZ04806.1 hypothetical protein [Candidatus Zambryskibacteria bacterium]